MAKAPEDVKAAAKVMYYQGRPQTEIAEELELTTVCISRWANKKNRDGVSWKTDRIAYLERQREEFQEKKTVFLREITGVSLSMILDSVKARATEDKPLTLNEAEQLARIVTSFDKIQKLDAGKPTDIKEEREVKAVTLEDLRNALEKDSFIELTPGDDNVYKSDTGKEHN